MANPYRTLSHKGRILIYLRARQPRYISSVELDRQAIEWGAKGGTVDRRCRELERDGRIEKKLVDGIVHYRLTQAETYIPAKTSYLDKLDKEEERQRQVQLI